MNKLVGFNYNNGSSTKEYIYQRNIQGDIIGIFDENGVQVGGYAYDGYGNQTITLNIDEVASLNPFRYRGYFYDEETHLYYLNSRYYDPETGRFISPDTLSILDETRGQINGLNLYMYCKDNPIMYVDSLGNIAGIAIVGIVLAILSIAATANDIYQIARDEDGVKVSVSNGNVHIQNSYKILTPWVRFIYSFYLNHFNPKTKDVIQGSSLGVKFEWTLHNFAAWLGIGGDSSKDLDIGNSIFSDGKSHPFRDEDGNITTTGIMSLTMRILYMLYYSPIYWILDLIVNGGF